MEHPAARPTITHTRPDQLDAEERWLPVVGEPGYQISDRGRVRSLDRTIMRRDGKPKRLHGRVLKPIINSEGYARVGLTERRLRSVHQLVLEAFVGPRPDGMQACHDDGIGTNNRLTNLRWDTSSANQLDRVRHGTHQEAIKTHCPRGHRLTSPNLDRGQLGKGKRICLACRRTHALRGRRRARGGTVPDFQELSDAYYAEIQSGARISKRVAQRLEANGKSGLHTEPA